MPRLWTRHRLSPRKLWHCETTEGQNDSVPQPEDDGTPPRFRGNFRTVNLVLPAQQIAPTHRHSWLRPRRTSSREPSVSAGSSPAKSIRSGPTHWLGRSLLRDRLSFHPTRHALIAGPIMHLCPMGPAKPPLAIVYSVPVVIRLLRRAKATESEGITRVERVAL